MNKPLNTVMVAGEPMREFSRSLPMALLRAREAVMNRFRPILREHGVTEQQWRVLRALYPESVLEAGDLAERCCLLTSSLTRIVKHLDSEGYLTRKPDTRDLRRVLVAITAKGRKLIETVAPLSEREYQAITDAFGAAKLDRLHDTLEALVDALER